MMSLADAASYFDRTPVYDADTGLELFRGQLDPYDDSRRDAGAAYRRVLSVKPGTTLPASRAVSIHDTVWLIGARETDGLDVAHRDKYVLQPAPRKLGIFRLPDFVSGGVEASSVWCGLEWLKDVKEVDYSSKSPSMYNALLAAGTDVRARDVIAYTGAAYLVVEAHDAPSGYRLATSMQLEQATPLSAQIVPRAFDPATGAFVSSGAVSVLALAVRWQSLFEYAVQGDERYQEGDCSIVLPAGTALTTRDRITMSAKTWAVVGVSTLVGAVVAHARPA